MQESIEGNGVFLLQRTLNKFLKGSDGLDLKLSVEKCLILHFGHIKSNNIYSIGLSLQAVKTVFSLEVTTPVTLKLICHMHNSSGNAPPCQHFTLMENPILYIGLIEIC